MSSITLYNSYNEIESVSHRDKFDFIYADCMYKDTNFSWLNVAAGSLKQNGILIIQTDYHTVAQYKIEMDEKLNFVNWLIYLNDWGGVPRNRFAQKHDDILIYCNGDRWKWYPERIQIPKATAGTKFDKKGTGTKTPPSVFYDHPSFSTVSRERVAVRDETFTMQKPVWLMERLLLPFTDEGDDVLDMFMGTGTLGVVSKRLGRNYVGFEANRSVFATAVRRIESENLHV